MINCDRSVVGGRQLRGRRGGRSRQESNRSEDEVGDHCGVKDKDTIRILTQNINGMGQVADSLKEMNLKTFTSNKMVDILAIQELNVCWTKVAHRNKIWDRFRGWKE